MSLTRILSLLIAQGLFQSLPILGANDPDHGPVIHSEMSVGVSYVLNKGQWPSQVVFRAEVNGMALFAEHGGLTFSKLEENAGELMHDLQAVGKQNHNVTTVKGHAWRMRFVGAHPSPALVPQKKKPHYLNYFIGNDPSRWKAEVPCYAEITYESLWPGIDFRLHSDRGQYKYDLLVSPGVDVNKIAMAYEGLDAISINALGQLVMQTSVGEVVEVRPVAWYANGAMESVPCDFVLMDGVVGFTLGAGTDGSRPIVIDPVLVAATLSGTGDIGTTTNYGHAATFDNQGNIYTGARCFGQGYPVTTGAFQMLFGEPNYGEDIVVSKLSPDGSALIYATYLGGNESDLPHSLYVSSSNELYVLGSSASTDYPVSSNAFDPTFNGTGGWNEYDIVVTHLNSNGSGIIGSTYIGGSGSDGRNQVGSNYGDQCRGEIIVDAAGNCMIAASSSSSDFPVSAGALQQTHAGEQDAVLFSLDPSLSILLFSTYLGGAGSDAGYGVVPDGVGGLYFCGSTAGDGFPSTAGAFQATFLGGERDAFLARISANGTVLSNATFFGTAQMDQAFFVDTDSFGFVYIYGESDGDVPIGPSGIFGSPGDVFVAKFEPDLSATLFTTEVGASGFDDLAPIAFLVDVCSNIYISSHSGLGGMVDGLPITSDAIQTNGGFYLAAFEPDMAAMLFGTYYGGGSDHVDGGTSRFDKNGVVYQGVCTNGGFNTTPGAFSSMYPSGYDVGVFKIDFSVSGVNAAGASAINTGCAPIQVDFSNASTGDTWLWDFGDGSPQVEAFEPSHLYSEPGDFTVTLIALDSLSCNLADTVYFQIQIGAQQPVEAALTWSQVEDCTEMRITAVNNSTGDPLDHIWQLSDGTEYTTDSISHVFDEAGSYEVILIAFDPTGCSQSDTIVSEITVAPLEFEFDIADRVLCQDGTVTLDAGQINGNYTWNTGATSPTLQVEDLGSYWVTISNAAGCIGTDTVQVIEAPTYDLAFQVTTCPGVTVPLRIPLDNAAAYLWDTGSQQRTIEVAGEVGTYAFAIIDQFGCVHQDSAKVELFDADVQLYAPNAFSPNGDGINDTFDLLGYGDRTLEMSIFNRWGEQLYATVSMDEPWDGTFKGTPVTNDVYVYVLTYTGMCTGNEEFKRTGHVTVIR